ncbi:MULTISPECIES: ABC transporter permease [unclassified Actinomyces]|uniref:ABC transporter permease n=1 Tax=unclassified Actinomyces TaxID=2609248 RepID=UPI0013740CEB|nr:MULTISPECIES: ABC transporter permease [unclassified Actinomyces]MBW3068375.1 ABC transporter permease [Actinomyces sp. 594]NDR53778.1 ABC transporter permease [Actinomyces sp. 565]QHO90551.1 ABC transporter permease [Actinomyces sp. 432]
MTGVFTGFFGALVEAWAQLRIGKLRVMLSLVGVGAAVAAMTFVIALGQVTSAIIDQEIASYAGRPGTVRIDVAPTGRGVSGDFTTGSDDPGVAEAMETAGTESGTDTTARITEAQMRLVERYSASSWATNYPQQLRLAFPGGSRSVETNVVSLGYGTLHHTAVAQGRWFSAADEDDLSPALVVSQGFLEQLGYTTLDGPLTVRAHSPARTTYTIVGVLKPDDLTWCAGDVDASDYCTQSITAYALAAPYERWLSQETRAELPAPILEIWAGQEQEQELISLATKDLDAQFGAGSTSAWSNTAEMQGLDTSGFTTTVTIAGVFVMILGALSLINISMVTVKQRIHEIGVRRSFGATSRRIFFSIMLESVVATVVAGVIGIGIAIVGMRVAPLDALLGVAVETRPPFPMSAALIGLIAATVVGALSGIIPALVAVRIKPIDAIRY